MQNKTQFIERICPKIDAEQSSISISDNAFMHIQNLEDHIGTLEQKSLICIIRCWNKSAEELVALKEKLEYFQQHCPMIKGALICIHGENDQGNQTSIALENMLHSGGIPMIPIVVHHYNWTSGLNAGIAVLNELSIDTNMLSVWNMSFDISLDEEYLSELHTALLYKSYVCTVRNNPDGHLPKSYRLMESVAQELQRMFTDPTPKNLRILIHAMRNTCTILPLNDIIELGGFNPLCNGLTHEISKLPNELWPVHDERIHEHFQVLGMEDIEFLLRMLYHKYKLEPAQLKEQFTKMTEVLIRYDDSAWNAKDIDAIHTKLRDEVAAVRKIIPGGANDSSAPNSLDEHLVNEVFRLLLEHDQGIIPNEMRDFRF